VALRLAPARAAEVLGHTRVDVRHTDGLGHEVAGRLANLAAAACAGASFQVRPYADGEVPDGGRIVFVLGGVLPADSPAALVTVGDGYDTPVAARVVTALETAAWPVRSVAVLLDGASASDEQWLQHAAVGLLDGLCAALADIKPPVLP
jgi:hypothetical protein